MFLRPNLYDYLKVLALITMIVDHIGYFLYPELVRLRLVGRIAFPLFLLLVGYNLSYARRWSLWISALLVQAVIVWCYRVWVIDYFMLNILIAIALTRVFLWWFSHQKPILQQILFALTLLLAWTTLWVIEYGTFSLAFWIAWFRLRKNMRRSIRAWLVLVCWYVVSMITSNWYAQDLWLWCLTVAMLLIYLWWKLSKGNLPFHLTPRRDRGVVFVSKRALWIYILQWVILAGIAYLRYQA
jgi:hypothetical protein